MDTAGIAGWEQTPYWVPELQRVLAGTGAQVSACRIEQDVHERLARQWGQLVIVPHAGQRVPLRLIQRWIDRGVRCHLVLTEDQAALRWFLHEVGATSVFDVGQARRSLVGICEQWANLGSLRGRGVMQ
jgi:hypothetical protein